MTSAPVAQNESIPSGCTERHQNGVAPLTSVAIPRIAGTSSVSAGDSGSSGLPPPVYLVRHDSGIDVYGQKRSETLFATNESQHGVAEEHLSFDILKPALSLREEVFNAIWSPDGIHLAVNTAKNGVVVYSHPTWRVPLNTAVVQQKLLRFPTSVVVPPRSLRHIQWSPRGTFLVGFWQYDGKSNVVPPPGHGVCFLNVDERNVLVWKVLKHGSKRGDEAESEEQLRPMVGFTLRGISLGQWPVLKWRSDEMFCCLTSRSDIVVYDGKDPGGKVLQRVPISGVVQVQLAPPEKGAVQNKLTFSGFSPSTQDSAGAFYVVEVTFDSSNGLSSGSWRIVTERVLEDVDSAEMRWNCSGSSVVLLANATVDAAGRFLHTQVEENTCRNAKIVCLSGENYGGVGDAYLAKTDGSAITKVNQKVALEACWSPVRNEFILIEGKSPSEIRLYDENGKVLFAFPNAYCNTVRWDAFGCMLALGGFGNLADSKYCGAVRYGNATFIFSGDLSFWYRDADKNNQELITQWREGCTVLCEWAPEGGCNSSGGGFNQYVWRRGFRDGWALFLGRMLIKREFAELFDIQWKPVSHSTTLRVPERPTPQAIAPQQSRKFRPSRESVGGPDGKRPTPQVPFSAAVASTTTTSPALNVTLAAARNEKNRQIQAMMDWRSREPAALPRTANPSAAPGTGSGAAFTQQGLSKPDVKSRATQGLTKSSGGATEAPKASDASKVNNQTSLVTKTATSTSAAPNVTPSRGRPSVRTADEMHCATVQAEGSVLAPGESITANTGMTSNDGCTRAPEPRELIESRDAPFFRRKDREMQMLALNAAAVDQHHVVENSLPSSMLTEPRQKEDRGSAQVDALSSSIDSGLVSTVRTRGVEGQQESTANRPLSGDRLKGIQVCESQQGVQQNITAHPPQDIDEKQPGLLSLLKRILPPTAQVHVEPFTPFDSEAVANGHSTGVIAKPQSGLEKPNVWAGDVVPQPMSSSSVDQFGQFPLNQKQHQLLPAVQRPLFSAAYESVADKGLWTGRRDNFPPVVPQQEGSLRFAAPGPPTVCSVPTPDFFQEAQHHQRGWNINPFQNGTGSLKAPGAVMDSAIMRDIRQTPKGPAALLRHPQPNILYQQETDPRLSSLRQHHMQQQYQLPHQSDEEAQHDAFLLQRELHYHQQRHTALREEQEPVLPSTVDGFHDRNTGRRTGTLEPSIRRGPMSRLETPSAVSYPPLASVADGALGGSTVNAGDAMQGVNEVEKLLQVLRHIGQQPLSEQHGRERRLVGCNASEASKNKMVDQSCWSLPTKPPSMFSGVASEPRPHSYSQFSQMGHCGPQVSERDPPHIGVGSDNNLPHNSFLPGWHQIESTSAGRPVMPVAVRSVVDRNFYDRQESALSPAPSSIDVASQTFLENPRPSQPIPDGRSGLTYGGSMSHGPPKLTKNSVITSDPMTDVCWEYVDLKGVVRGPFHANDMRKWFCAGYFSNTLPVRYSKAAPFKALRELFANEDTSFAEPPSITQPERYPGSLTQNNHSSIAQNRLFPPVSSNSRGELPPEKTSETGPAKGAPSSGGTSPFMSFS